ncbi:hypothetical protein Ocin01_04980 [Orchesella cincta]|uniref:Uncharacterized protein n=1 Tax=Orchesella cincta TaxID=48709 RepID=A0A1D2N9D1_ORCCI|nr:hypothetical protein Ocin01_04980 [Orchesella cincta]
MKSETSARSQHASASPKSTKPKSRRQVSQPKEEGSDTARLKTILENLDIRFKGCTFTYKLSHLQSPVKKKQSKLSRISMKISNTLERVREAISCEKSFKSCVFLPTHEEEKVKDFIQSNFSETKLSFENCKFMQRGSTVMEKIAQKFRKAFGIQFELDYINSSAEINTYTFRVKDIPIVNFHIQERILEEA